MNTMVGVDLGMFKFVRQTIHEFVKGIVTNIAFSILDMRNIWWWELANSLPKHVVIWMQLTHIIFVTSY